MHKKVKEKLFEGQSFYVGIDCHKKSWKVTILGEHYEHKTMSQDPDPDQLASYLQGHFPGGSYQVVYEAGFSGFGACRRLRALGLDCQVVHPADVPTNQKERLQKTDKVDSRKLARSLRGGELEGIHMPGKDLEADRALLRQRYRLTKDVSRIKHRVKSLLLQFGVEIPSRFTASQSRHWSKVYLTWLSELPLAQSSLKQVIANYLCTGQRLREQVLIINGQLKVLSQSPAYQHNYQLLLTVPGIGPLVAMSLLVQIGDIRRFKRLDALCNYVGLVPSMHGSGEKLSTGKLVPRGRKELKIMLIEASWVGIRQDPALMAKFNTLVKVMPKNKAIIRIARKMLGRIRHVLIYQQAYVLGVV